MLAYLLETLYYGLKAIGLWQRLLAVHKAKEISNVQSAINRMSDAELVQRLRTDFTLPGT